MRKIDLRKIQVLKIVVEGYIKTGEITGSKSLLKKHDMGVSSATVRNDMAALEKMGLIFQPYNSAGRLPTTRGIRVFVDYLMEHMGATFVESENEIFARAESEKVDDALYHLVARLTNATKEIAFACVPGSGTSCYLGLSNYVERQGPSVNPETYGVIRVLENKHRFLDLVSSLDLPGKVGVFIGEENAIPELETSAMIVRKTELEGKNVLIGILGPLKMDYAFNIAALRNLP
ncbi:MAG: heat-inducible transcriptional repressor [Patescibacteria group bacterium]|nr:heat-inducible transcriptional repressor [Patescibacteria group bacterium]